MTNLKIIVCIKQVPGTTKVDIDPETGVLKRSGVSAKMNPYDLFGLETALRLKAEYGAHITVISMGPPQAETVIREAYMMGADDGVLMTDRKFAGADVLATSYTLAAGIRKIGDFDLIICGKQTTDGDTAQVGPAMAEHLGIPHVTWVSNIESVDETGVIAEQNMEDSLEAVRLKFPCLISVEKDIFTPRLPSYRNKLLTADRPVRVLTFNDLDDSNENNYGLTGSPTQVERIFQPEPFTDRELWDLPEEVSSYKLIELLESMKFI